MSSFPTIDYEGNFEVIDLANPQDYVNPASPYVGWWKQISKSTWNASAITSAQEAGDEPLSSVTNYYNKYLDGTPGSCPYMYVENTENLNVFKVTFYGGVLDQVFAYTQTSCLYELMADGISIGPTGGFQTPSFSTESFLQYFFDAELQTQNVFTMQPDNQHMAEYLGLLDPTLLLDITSATSYSSTSIWEKTSVPIIQPYGPNEQNGAALQTPTALFKYYDDVMTQKAFQTVNTLQPDMYYPGYEQRLAIYQSYLDGKTVTYPIKSLVTSTQGNYGYYSYTNGVTLLLLHVNPHLVMRGSSITFSGFAGSYAFLNGTHNNIIFLEGNSGYKSSDHFDVDYAAGTGSFFDCANWFAINVNTSACDAVADGPYKGWGTNFGNPTVTVTHHVKDDMSYNNYIAAQRAYYTEVFNNPDVHGRQYYGSRSRKQLCESFSENFNIQSRGTFVPYWRSGGSSGDAMYNYIGPLGAYFPIMCDHYNIYDTIETALPDSAYIGMSIDALNYLEEAYNIYYGFTGPYLEGDGITGAAGVLQQVLCSIVGVHNQGDPSMIGGGIMVATGSAYYGGEPVDHSIWQIAGNYGDPNGDYDPYYYNYMIYGLVKQELTPGKKVGYIYTVGSNSFGGDDGFLFTTVFTDPEILANSPQAFQVATDTVRFLPAIKYFNAQNCDAVIIDNRNDAGGSYGNFEQLFGGDRNQVQENIAYYKTKTGVSPPVDFPNFTAIGGEKFSCQTLNAPLPTSYIESAYGADSVYHGSVGSPRKVVFLQGSGTYSAGTLRMFNFLGDNNDGDIGNNTQVKIVGCNKAYENGAIAWGRCMTPSTYYTNPDLGTAYYGTSLIGESPVTFSKKNADNSTLFTTVIDDATAVGELSSTTYPWPQAVGNRALPMSVEQTFYPDLGFVENTRPILPGWAGSQQPDSNDYTTWRDSILETAIQEALSTEW